MKPEAETFLARAGRAILIEIVSTKGSVPRETDAFMLVSQDDLFGTIGGGNLESIAIENARALLTGKGGDERMDIPLGPAIGQCCGGRVELAFAPAEGDALERFREKLRTQREKSPSVWIFGIGHVGKALADALALLPLDVHAVDTRQSEMEQLPATTHRHLAPIPEALVREAAPGSAVIIVTHDHSLDFLIAGQALARTDLSYVGMIGSKTKRATFSNWFTREGGSRDDLDRLTLPIGGKSVSDKRPEVIAAMTIAEVLVALSAHRR